MALLAQKVVAEAKKEFRTADGLAIAMQPHLLQLVSNSKIYQYTSENEEREHNVPPGDVLLAAALVAGISIDEKLGLVRQASDIDVLRAQVAEMREEMASLRAAVIGGAGAPVQRSEAPEAVTPKASRAAARRAWAQQSKADTGPPAEPTNTRRSGRSAGR
jgi:hypothetical protein